MVLVLGGERGAGRLGKPVRRVHVVVDDAGVDKPVYVMEEVAGADEGVGGDVARGEGGEGGGGDDVVKHGRRRGKGRPTEDLYTAHAQLLRKPWRTLRRGDFTRAVTRHSVMLCHTHLQPSSSADRHHPSISAQIHSRSASRTIPQNFPSLPTPSAPLPPIGPPPLFSRLQSPAHRATGSAPPI